MSENTASIEWWSQKLYKKHYESCTDDEANTIWNAIESELVNEPE